MKKITLALLVLSLLLAWSGPVRAEEDGAIAPAPDIVTTCAELTQWAGEHSAVGGTVYLGADILWEAGASLITAEPVIIEMGAYSITVPTDTALNPGGPFVFTGAGDADGKLFLIEDGGVLLLNEPAVIQAQGDGVTAVRVLWPNGLQNGYASVSAYGDGAVAVNAPNGLETANGIYYAQGAGAAAIASAGAVHLIFCEVSAEGEGAAAVRADGPITLDTTYTSPVPDAAEVVERVFDAADYFATRGWIHQFYLAPGEDLSLPAYLPASLRAPEGEAFSVRPELVWDTSQMDTNTPGHYPCTGTLRFPLEHIPIQGAEPLEAHVYVVDRQLPHLILYKETAPGRGTLGLLDPVSPTAERELWGSGDGGDTWAQITIDELSAALHEVSFASPFQDVCDSYQFMLVVRDGDLVMSSNILEVNDTSAGIKYNDIGGERQGTDRGEGLEKPDSDVGSGQAPEPEPPETEYPNEKPVPTPEPPDLEPEDLSPPAPSPTPAPIETPIHSQAPPNEIEVLVVGAVQPEPPPTPSAAPTSAPGETPVVPSEPGAATEPAVTDDIPDPAPAAPPYVAAVQATPLPPPVSDTPAPAAEQSPTPSPEAAAADTEPEEPPAPPSAVPPMREEPSYPLIRPPSFGAVAVSLVLVGSGVLIGVLSWKRRGP